MTSLQSSSRFVSDACHDAAPTTRGDFRPPTTEATDDEPNLLMPSPKNVGEVARQNVDLVPKVKRGFVPDS